MDMRIARTLTGSEAVAMMDIYDGNREELRIGPFRQVKKHFSNSIIIYLGCSLYSFNKLSPVTAVCIVHFHFSAGWKFHADSKKILKYNLKQKNLVTIRNKTLKLQYKLILVVENKMLANCTARINQPPFSYSSPISTIYTVRTLSQMSGVFPR